jgi:V8-like Glu-specific endopeptidase
MIGYPCGFPLKYTYNAWITKNESDNPFFTTNLDAFSSNSGSPVFDLESNNVIGILISGESDYVKIDGCLRILKYYDLEIYGETCTKIYSLFEYLQQLIE